MSQMSRAEGLRRVVEFDLANLVFGVLPRRVSYTLMSIVAWIVVTLIPGNVAGLRRNLEVVFPDATPGEIRGMIRRNARNYAKFWVDLFRVPRIDPRRQERLVGLDGEENVKTVLEHGRGCVVVAIHMGGWEGCASFWGSLGYHTGLIAEVLEPPALWRRIRALRQRTGLELIPLSRTAPREILRRLKDNGVVAGAIDRDILGTASTRSFFGHLAPIPTGLVEIAQRTGAGIVPVVTLREPGERYLIIGGTPVWVEPGADGLERAMGSLLGTFEGWIREYPDQWHVMVPIFGGAAGSASAADGEPFEEREVAVG